MDISIVKGKKESSDVVCFVKVKVIAFKVAGKCQLLKREIVFGFHKLGLSAPNCFQWYNLDE